MVDLSLKVLGKTQHGTIRLLNSLGVPIADYDLQEYLLLYAVFESILIPQAVLNELCAGSPNIEQKIHDAGYMEVILL